jgi:hypothetical protein
VQKVLTGAIFGKGLMAPAEPTEIDGSRKSINPASVLKDPSRRLVIRETFPTLPHLLKSHQQPEKSIVIVITYESITPRIFEAVLAMSTISSLVKSIPPATCG